MKIAVFSDVHGNLNALQAVLSFLENQNIDQFVCLGDTVGYGPRPEECLQIIADTCDISIAGNHDCAVAGRIDDGSFNQHAQTAVRWTQQQLSEKSMAYLKELPFKIELDNILFAHATPHLPEDWNYVFSVEEAREEMDKILQPLSFIGHSHLPMIFSYQEGQFGPHTRVVNLEKDRFIINVGSVGQPRDADPRACCVIFEPFTSKLSFHRITYNIDETCHQIFEAKLPHSLGERLKTGH